MKIWNKKKKYSDNFQKEKRNKLYGSYILFKSVGLMKNHPTFENWCKMKSEQLNLLKVMS